MQIYKHKQAFTDRNLTCVLLISVMASHFCAASTGESSRNNPRSLSREEMPALLNLIAERVRANYMRIETWSGEIEKKVTFVHTGSSAEELFNATDSSEEAPEIIVQEIEEKCTFAFDAKTKSVYFDTVREKPPKFFDHKSGADLGNRGAHPYWSTLITKPDSIITVNPQTLNRKENRIVRRKAEKKTPQPGGPGNPKNGLIYGDPRSAFFPSPSFSWDVLNGVVKRLNAYGQIEVDAYKFKIEEHTKKNNEIEYRVVEPSVMNQERSKPEHFAITTKIFSTQCGLNMTYFEVATGNGTVLHSIAWKYELVNGVYLPKRVVRIIHGADGQVTSEHDHTYLKNAVNHKIRPDTFEYTNLRLKDGDIFFDRILNKEYRYKGSTGSLEPVKNE